MYKNSTHDLGVASSTCQHHVVLQCDTERSFKHSVDAFTEHPRCASGAVLKTLPH